MNHSKKIYLLIIFSKIIFMFLSSENVLNAMAEFKNYNFTKTKKN